MSVDLSEHAAGPASAHEPLDELRTAQDEFGNFFGDVFDQLQSLSLELFARHKCLELGVENVPQENAELREILVELRGLGAEFRGLKEDVERERVRIQELFQTAWQEEKAALEAELDAVRRHAASQGEALAEQRRLASQQQGEITGELKRMRSLIETLTQQMRNGRPGKGDADGATRPPDSEVLGSVLAQFELLQRDVARRRKK